VSTGGQLLALGIFIGITALAAFIGGLATGTSVTTWYPTLVKPSWNPPAWVFGPVWTTLYLMMAIAAWLVWRKKGLRDGAAPIGLYCIQLALNAVWSVLFFGLHSPGLALIDIAVLWCAIAATTWTFIRQSLPAGLLMIPYWLWVTFASALNAAIYHLN